MKSRLFHGHLSFWAGFLSLVYVVLGLLLGFAHTHEPDLHFHDNCPACQWQVQANDSDSSSAYIWSMLFHVPEPTRNRPSCSVDKLSHQFFEQGFSSRAPPFAS